MTKHYIEATVNDKTRYLPINDSIAGEITSAIAWLHAMDHAAQLRAGHPNSRVVVNAKRHTDAGAETADLSDYVARYKVTDPLTQTSEEVTDIVEAASPFMAGIRGIDNTPVIELKHIGKEVDFLYATPTGKMSKTSPRAKESALAGAAVLA